MLNKLRNINNKLINYYKGNDIEYKKQLKIKNILIDDSCFHNFKRFKNSRRRFKNCLLTTYISIILKKAKICYNK